MATKDEFKIKFVTANKLSEDTDDEMEALLGAFARFRKMLLEKYPESPLATKTAVELLGRT